MGSAMTGGSPQHQFRIALAIVALLALGPPDFAAATDKPERIPRIIGGQETRIEKWPWHVAITRNPALNGAGARARQRCAGSLVAPTIVVTAAHCVFDAPSKAFLPPTNFASITGRTTLSNEDEGEEIPWRNYYVFVSNDSTPLFSNTGAHNWDVAFAKLAWPSTSPTIQLAGAAEEAAWAPGDENAYTTGWGRTSAEGMPSDTLRVARVDIIADDACSRQNSYGNAFNPALMLCAGEFAGGQSTCDGDSGGPLVVPIGGGDFRLVGASNWASGCALPNYASVYARLADRPMCSALRNAIAAVIGIDIVGTGACLNGDPTPAGFIAIGDESDVTAPETGITDRPRRRTRKREATFDFEASEPSTFRCSLDSGEFSPCESDVTITVTRGKHRLRVQAVDAIGNADPTPATARWRVKKRRS